MVMRNHIKAFFSAVVGVLHNNVNIMFTLSLLEKNLPAASWLQQKRRQYINIHTHENFKVLQNKMKTTLLIIKIALILSVHVALAQETPWWESWDKKYQEVNIPLLLEQEQHYADSIENDPDAAKFYTRQKGYRFKGTFTGQWRALTNERREVMKLTYKIFTGENPIFDQTKNEVQIQIGDHLVWMPIQAVLEEDFKKEIKKGKDVYLYTLYFNHHKQDGTLYNIFFISEFRAL